VGVSDGRPDALPQRQAHGQFGHVADIRPLAPPVSVAANPPDRAAFSEFTHLLLASVVSRLRQFHRFRLGRMSSDGSLPLFHDSQDFHNNSQIFSTGSPRILRAAPNTMKIERRDLTLWRERDWRCERWIVDGRPEVRLYFGSHQMSELADGPQLDLQQQTVEWLAAVRADCHRT
jgi:hypothetical protein